MDIKVDLTPVDFVAGGIVHLSRNKDYIGGEFNMLNREPLRLKMMAEFLQSRDANIKSVTLAEWRAALAELASSVPAEVLGLLTEVLAEEGEDGDGDFIPPAFLTRFDCSKAETALKGTDIQCHPVNEELLAIYRDNLDKLGFFDLAAAAR